MNGIGAKPVTYAGTIRLRLAGHDTEFIVVSTNFPKPFVVILGSGFFKETQAKINFNENLFEVNNYAITLRQQRNPLYEIEHGRITNLGGSDDPCLLPFVNIINPPTGKSEIFLVDTGSEVNLIGERLLPAGIEVKETSVHLRRIGPDLMSTLGSIEIKHRDLLHRTKQTTFSWRKNTGS